MVRRPRWGLLRTAVVTALSAALALPTVGAISAPASAAEATGSAAQAAAPFKALLFSKTAAFRHDSIPAGIAAIQALGAANDFTVDATEDATAFTAANLAQYKVVIFLSTTGDVLNATQQTAFETYIRNGGGYAGIHSASDTEYDWPFYGNLVGAYFSDHPPGTPTATVKTEDLVHPSTAHLPALATRTDELYNYRTNPRDKVHVLQSYDEKTYTGGTMGADHPITWCQDYEGGRSWYTGQGHTQANFSEPGFLQLLLGGIKTAAGDVDADCSATQTKSFDKVTLDAGTQNPMDVAPAPNGRTYYLERDGRVQMIAPNGGTTEAGRIGVTTVQEFGLLGIELDRNFATNGYMYLYYSPTTGNNDRVSRFTTNAAGNLDLTSEKVLLEIPVQRAECCHAGGALQFDTKGNLYIATGDNTNPFASDGFTPIDERAGRSSWDAQRTSGNTNDLRGKLLRIHPEADGTYTVPQGNLFAPGTALTKPEIYAMGFRNPFKIGMDPRTDTVLVGNYGPDAGTTNPNRGPDGRVEWDALSQPGNYGWPYCVGANTPYNDYNFATATAGPAFDCAGGPTNDSPNNTGLQKLPPAIAADVWYGYGTNPLFPEIGGGGAPMAGSVYQYNATSTSTRKWPQYYDGKAIFGEWNQGRLYTFQLANQTDALTDINRILPGMSFLRPHAMEWGADGALYVIEWGSGFNGNNADSGLYRIDYVSGSRAPIARITADKTSGPLPLTVKFESTGSRDPDGTEVTFLWNFGDGTPTSTEANPTHVYTTAGNFTATLTVKDADGQEAAATQVITAGNTAPTITVAAPPDGGFFNFGDLVKYKVTVTDPEDGTIDCNNVIAQPALGHDQHAHPYDQYRGCEGIVPVPGDAGHIGANIFGVITFSYTDKGGAGGAGALTARTSIILQPKHKEAEYFASTGRLAGSTSGGDPGVQTETTTDTGGGLNVGFGETGDWFAFDPTNLTNITGMRLRLASQPGGTVSVRTGSPTGPEIGSVTVPAGGWQNWATYTVTLPANVSLATGPLYFVNSAGQTNYNWIEFVGRGVTDNETPLVAITATPTTGTSPLNVVFTTTATDPEGDTPLTYAWTFGDGGTATTANPSHVYTAPGKYTATVTVRDSRGGSTVQTVEINVTAPNTRCLTGRSDDFLGTSLDRTRWTTVIRENQDLKVEGGNLVVPTSATDIYQTTNTTPNIVLQPLQSGAWQATTKITMPQALQAYQQAGLVVYGDDNNYAKMVISGRNTGAFDAATRVFQFSKETAAVVSETNSANIGAAYPGTVWVRITSDGTTLTGSYSSDGVTFTNMSATKNMTGITNPRIGLLTLQGGGRTQATVDAQYDYFNITPDDTATAPTPNDEFNGTALDGCRWSVLRPDPARMRVQGGFLELDTTTGDIYSTPNQTPSNFVLQPQPSADWTVETKVDGSAFSQQYQQGGLIAYVDDDNYIKLDTLTTNTAGSAVTRQVELRSEIGGVVQNPQPSANVTSGVWYLRLKKAGNVFTGSYSADGTTWTTFATLTNAPVAAGARVGLFTLGAASTVNATAKFDYFRVVTDTTAPVATATLSPAAPNGSNGWHTSAVTVNLAATDDSGSASKIEYKLDGATTYTTYTLPFAVSADGSHSVVYRATDAAGNVSTDSTVTFKIDATQPVVNVTAPINGSTVGDSGKLTPAWTATDATSGVASTTATLDGKAIASGTSVTLYELTLGQHTLVVTSTDNAGNVTTSTTTFTVGTSFDDIDALIGQFVADGTISAKTAANLRYSLDKARQSEDSGSEKYTVVYLQQFIDRVNSQVKGDARDLMVRQLLRRDAEALIAKAQAAEAAENA